MFHKARIRLTAWYLLIIMLLSISFSLAIYSLLSTELERFAHIQRIRIERGFQHDIFPQPNQLGNNPPPIIDPDLIEESKDRLKVMLLLINAGILFAAGGLSFFLASRTLRPIRQMVDEQSRFVSDASHELRTPLTSLKSMIEVSLRDKNLTLLDAKKLMQENIADVDRLETLTSGLLQLTHVDSQEGLHFQKTSLSNVLLQALKQAKPFAEKKHITIKDQLHKQELIANEDALIQLFSILLDNAIKYSPEKSTITLSSTKESGKLIVNVKDLGEGISEKDLPHIFERFYRADRARTNKGVGGYGLGLSIAKRIVVLHHGTINVKSKLNNGTIFSITLPIQQKNFNKTQFLFSKNSV